MLRATALLKVVGLGRAKLPRPQNMREPGTAVTVPALADPGRSTVSDRSLCSVDGCQCNAACRGWCWSHYKRWRKDGDPGQEPTRPRSPKPATCTIDGCDRPTEARGWCWAHYYRWRRTGDVGGPEVKVKNPGQPCAVAECGHTADSLGYCLKHYTRVHRHGAPDVVLPATNYGERNGSWRGDDAGYGAIHQRLRNTYGSASSHLCVGCGGWAADWSYNYTAADERISQSGPSRGCPYSPNLEDYSPRCRSCHRIFDFARG